MRLFAERIDSLADPLDPGFGYDLFFINTTDGLPALVPLNTRVKYMNDICVGNALFSTMDDVAKAWPEAIPNG